MDIITNKAQLLHLLKQQIPNIDAVCDEPMKNHTSFHIGGNADIFVSVKSEAEIISCINFFKEHDVAVTIIGNGSNLLVSDDGIEGAVVCIGKGFSDVSCNGCEIKADSGVLLSKIASLALEHGLTGFEFASGIPGSLGGAIVMNAGAYGGEMKDCVVTTRYLDNDGNICQCSGDEHAFGYRKSRFKDGEIILSATIKLRQGDSEQIKAEMRSLAEKRREKQPLEYPSAGSTFKRPEGAFAAKLIDDAGLRGYSIGDAAVSDKHCGFVINKGEASFEDVIALMDHIKTTVREKFGFELEPEVRILGR